MKRDDIVSTQDLIVYFDEQLIKNSFVKKEKTLYTLHNNRNIWVIITPRVIGGFIRDYRIELVHSSWGICITPETLLMKLELLNVDDIYSRMGTYYVDYRELVDDFFTLAFEKDAVKNENRMVKLKKIKKDLVDSKKGITFVV